MYLEPDPFEAHIHLALLMETQGDAAAAEVLRTRARAPAGTAAEDIA